MKKILSKIHHANNLELAGKMYLFFLVLFFKSISFHYFFVGIALLSTYIIFERKFIFESKFWLATLLLLLPGVYFQFNITANHAFLACYIAVIFLLATYYKNLEEKVLYFNSKLLLFVIMGFAVIQKLLSEIFLSGGSLLFINYNGGFFTHFQRFFPKNQEIIHDNLKLIQHQKSSIESLQTTIELFTPDWLLKFDSSVLVWFIIIVEVLFCVMLFVKNQYLRNFFLLSFMIALITFRIETGFACLLCVLLFLQAQKDKPIFKLAYIFIFGLFMSMILTRLGAA